MEYAVVRPGNTDLRLPDADGGKPAVRRTGQCMKIEVTANLLNKEICRAGIHQR
jgi:hypothetical protein